MKVSYAGKIDKKNVFLRLLEKGTVLVVLDSRKPQVALPSEHMHLVQVALNFDYAYNLPDLNITDERIEATLEFGPTLFFCVIPFEAVYSLRSDFAGEVVVFPESLPKEFATPPPTTPVESTQAPKSHLRTLSVISNSTEESNVEKSESNLIPLKKPTTKKRNHLKLVE